jgi:hypothetical protein
VRASCAASLVSQNQAAASICWRVTVASRPFGCSTHSSTSARPRRSQRSAAKPDGEEILLGDLGSARAEVVEIIEGVQEAPAEGVTAAGGEESD